VTNEGYQLDRCDVCGRKLPRRDLVRTNVRWLQPEGSNYLTHSSYHTDQWTVDTSTDRSTIGYGPHGDKQRITIPDAVAGVITPAYTGCSQTWSAAGTLRSVTTAIDVSGLTQFVFSVDVAQVLSWSSNIASASDLTVAMGLCDSAGANTALQKTWTDVSGLLRCWFQMDVADIASPLSSSGIYVYATVTPDTATDYWLVDDMSIEGDVARPTQFITTTGTAVTAQTATKVMAMRKVCPRCREDLLRESEPPSSHEQRVEAPVSSAPQQV